MAKLELLPEMNELILHRLSLNGAAQENMKLKKDPRRLLIYAGECFVGEREKTGNNDGNIIRMIQETVGNAVREPYCLSFIMTLIAFVEKVYGIKSKIHVTEHCMTCWRNTSLVQRVEFNPNPGAIGIYNHAGTDSGHATLFVEPVFETIGGAKRKFAHNIEANTTNGLDPNGEIVREGGGIYWTKRPWSANVGNMKFIGHLKPF